MPSARTLPARLMIPQPDKRAVARIIGEIRQKHKFFSWVSAETQQMILFMRACGMWVSEEQKKRPAEFFDDNPPENYREVYLKSDAWKMISARVQKSQGRLCFICGTKATEVHHRSYAPRVMEGLDDTQLVALCRNCHNRVEFDEDGWRRSRSDQDAILCGTLPVKRLRKSRHNVAAKQAAGEK